MTIRIESRPARDRILDAAAELFYQKGIRNVGVDEIVACAGVAKMTLYSHFKSKDLLILEFLRRRHSRWMEWFEGEVNRRARDPRDKLIAIFGVLDGWFRDPEFRGCAFINAAVELADPEHPGHRASVEHKLELREYIRDLAAMAKVADPEALSQQILLLVEGSIVVALMGGQETAAGNGRAAAEALLAAP